MSDARAILGAGLVTLSLFDEQTQAFLGFGAALDADKFEIVPGYEEKTSTSKSHLDYGQARATVILPKPTELNITIAAASSAALAMQFQGVLQTLNQGAATVTDEAVTLKVGKWVKLANRNIVTAGFGINDAGTPATAYALGTDFEVNYARGEVKAIDGGAISADTPVLVDYSANAVTATEILGGRNPQVRVQARFEGKNLVNGAALECDVREAVLGSSAGFDFLASDFNGIELKGKIVTPTGYTEGYVVRQF